MANELNLSLNTSGLTLVAQIFANNFVQQGVNIAMVETGAGTGLYVGSVPGAPAIAEGEYTVLFLDTIGPPINTIVGQGELYWAGSAEDRRAVHSMTAYERGIWVDTQGGGAPGAVIDVNGTPTNPCSVMADAIAIAAALGRNEFMLHGPVTLPSALPHSVFTAVAGGSILDAAGFDIGGSIFNKVGLTGAMGVASGPIFGFNTFLVGPISGLVGTFFDPALSGTITMGTGTLTLVAGASTVPATGTAIINLAGVGNLNLRAYSGGIELQGSTAPAQASTLEFIAGQLILNASNTAGTIVVRGHVAPLTDNSAGATVITTGVLQGVQIQEMYSDMGLDLGNPKTITENVLGENYGESTTSINKSVVKVAGVTTITRL